MIENQNTSNEFRWLSENDYEFFGKHIGIVSYPRSGNSLLRSLLEKITGIYTGCDTRPDRTLSKELQSYGMKGEGIVDSSVCFIKSHYPERLGYTSFKANKIILVIRNPWDAFDSYFNMMLTNSHTISIHETQYERFKTTWEKFIINETNIWLKFHNYWLNNNNNNIPIMIVRYEDLLNYQEETLKRIFHFILINDNIDMKSYKDNIIYKKWENIIHNKLNNNNLNNNGPYKPRSGKLGKSFHHYTIEQFNYVLLKANKTLKSFGYDPISQNFPKIIKLPNKQIKNIENIGKICKNISNDKYEIRKENDIFGRLFTYFRKSLLDPVIAADNSSLNMDEVLLARKLEKKNLLKASIPESNKDI